MNNEIRRLVRCIVEASAESNIQFEEIQAEIAKQFGKEMLPQSYRDAEPKDFREKVKLFLRDEIGHYRICGKIEKVIELFCIFHDLRQEIPKEEMVPRQMITDQFVERCHIKKSTAGEYFTHIGHQIRRYLNDEKGIFVKKNSSMNEVLEVVYPFIVQM